MKNIPHHILAPFIVGMSLLLGCAAQAAQADKPLLPGGASSLQERYDDWQVVCTAANKGRQCALQQSQNDSKSGRRVLLINLAPTPDKGATGALVMPFGLAINNEVGLAPDDGANGSTARFKTCLPAGCIVPLSLDTATLTSYRTGKQLKVTAKTTDGQSIVFSLSLKGFGAAFERTMVLLK